MISEPSSFRQLKLIAKTSLESWEIQVAVDMKMKVLWTNSAQSSVIDTEESRHSQRKDQFVSLTLCFTTQQVDRQRDRRTWKQIHRDHCSCPEEVCCQLTGTAWTTVASRPSRSGS